MIQAKQKQKKNKVNLSIGKCEICQKFVSVLYFDNEKKIWKCKECRFKGEKLPR